jgi:hypothetical protein
MCLAAAERGWTLIFDPAITVRHRPAPRWDEDRRGPASRAATRDAAYNLVVILCTLRPSLRRRRALFGLLIGDRGVPGIARAAAAVVRAETGSPRQLGASLRGQVEALRDSRRPGRLSLSDCGATAEATGRHGA